MSWRDIVDYINKGGREIFVKESNRTSSVTRLKDQNEDGEIDKKEVEETTEREVDRTY